MENNNRPKVINLSDPNESRLDILHDTLENCARISVDLQENNRVINQLIKHWESEKKENDRRIDENNKLYQKTQDEIREIQKK